MVVVNAGLQRVRKKRDSAKRGSALARQDKSVTRLTILERSHAAFDSPASETAPRDNERRRMHPIEHIGKIVR
jgi:hypothetical protein